MKVHTKFLFLFVLSLFTVQCSRMAQEGAESDASQQRFVLQGSDGHLYYADCVANMKSGFSLTQASGCQVPLELLDDARGAVGMPRLTYLFYRLSAAYYFCRYYFGAAAAACYSAFAGGFSPSPSDSCSGCGACALGQAYCPASCKPQCVLPCGANPWSCSANPAPIRPTTCEALKAQIITAPAGADTCNTDSDCRTYQINGYCNSPAVNPLYAPGYAEKVFRYNSYCPVDMNYGCPTVALTLKCSAQKKCVQQY